MIEKYTEKAIEKIAEKTSEGILERALEFTKDAKDIIAVEFGIAFDKYIENSCRDLNLVKTIVDHNHFRLLTGKHGIFVSPQVQWQDNDYDIEGYRDFFKFGKNIIICGTGGLGKTMLMKFLFIDAANEGDYVPIYIRLRKFDKCIETTSLIDYINYSIGTYNIQMSKKQLAYCFSTGRMLLLFDGLDEVRHEKRRLCEEQIQDLQKKYPDNFYFVSSRHGGISDAELRSFSMLELCPLDKRRACNLISLLTKDNEKGKEFINRLKRGLYQKRKDFASNPLLLSIMFMTYDENNQESDQIIDFYEPAFSALYSRHDSMKGGVYNRQYLVKGLGMNMFKTLFSYLCFHSYDHNQYEFSYDEIINYITNGIRKLELNESLTKADDFLADLQEIVCLIVYEGTYRFTHRSFQSYFAAFYVSQKISDEDQKKFFDEQLTTRNLKDEYDFYKMIWSLQGEALCNSNILYPALRKELKPSGFIEMNNWDDAQILKYYVEKVYIKKSGNQVIFLRQNSNHKESVLTLLLLLNKTDYFTSIGLAQLFYDDDEWSTLFPVKTDDSVVGILDMKYLFEEEGVSETDSSDVYDIFCKRLGKDKAINFFIDLFKLRQIHNIFFETYKEMIREPSDVNTTSRWTDKL